MIMSNRPQFTAMRPSLIIPFLDSKMNVFGPQNRFAYLTPGRPETGDFSASIFGYRFGSASTRKRVFILE